MRIAHFTDTYLPRRDGVITSLRTLVAAQRAAGDRALTVVPRHPDQPAEADLLRLRALPVGVADLRVSPWLVRGSFGEATLREVADHDPDVIHVHTPGPVGLLGVLAARRLGRPLVQTYHTDLHAYADAYRVPVPALRVGVRLYARRLDLPRRPHPPADPGRPAARRAMMDACNQLLLGGADAVVVPTPAVLDRITLPVAPERIFVIPTGVTARPAPAAAVAALRGRFGLAPSTRVVLFVGRVNREKGIDLLLRALAPVLAERPDVAALLVGAVYEPRWLAGLLRTLPPDVARRMILAGQQPPEVVAAAYRVAAVFAFPSRTDTQALVLQEAALHGLPCVLADPVLHRHGPLGGRGVLAPPGGFGAAVARLLDDPVLARALGSAAAGCAVEHTPARFADAITEVYAYAGARAGRLTTRGRTRH